MISNCTRNIVSILCVYFARSRYVMLCTEPEKIDFANALEEYKQIERVVRHYCHDREMPEDEEVNI